MIKTLILTEKEGWHFQQLKKALTKINSTVNSACLSEISFNLKNNKSLLQVDGKPLPYFDYIIVRFIPGGSLEEITYYLNILKIFEAMGSTVFNTAVQIEKTVDKLYTSYFLSKNGINTPDTFVYRGYKKAQRFLENHLKKIQLVYKPLFGSQGDNIKLLTDSLELKQTENLSNIYYFQEYLENTINHDYRVLIIRRNNKCKIFNMTRYGNTFINNISKGASCKKEPLSDDVLNLAVKTSELLNMSFCGVDLMHYKNKYYVIEVNSIPAWRGLQDVESENISDQLIDVLFN
jgi:ribosomal protein S6--L-glutamate ligase/tetrahydromethanopterin:alpha-L-glutamate ligase